MLSSLPNSSWRSGAIALVCAFIFVTFTPSAEASGNVWRTSQNQVWFYEVRKDGGKPLAGTWWEQGLEPNATYTISFEVTRLEGTLGVHLGNRDKAIRISNTGEFSYDFWVPRQGGRKLMFTSLELPSDGDTVIAGVRKINVVKKSRAIAEGELEPSTPPFSDPTPIPTPTPAAEEPAPAQVAAAPAAPAPTPAASSATPSPYTGTFGHPAGEKASSPKGHYWFFSRERNLEQELLAYRKGTATRMGDYFTAVADNIHSALTTDGVAGFGLHINWRTMEVADGKFNWDLLDANMRVANEYGLKLIVKVVDRSFDGSDVMPRYFGDSYRLWTEGNGTKGFVSARWKPYVYTRKIRMNKAIINRYRDNPAFAGIASTETAMGDINYPDYSLKAYQDALYKVTTETQAALPPGTKYFFYLNFLQGGVSRDMRNDSRIRLMNRLDSDGLVIGAPDVTPDVVGMPGSMNSVRVHLKNTRPEVGQFCHLQHVDQGLGQRNLKDNKQRREFYDFVASNAEWARKSGAVYVFDDLRDSNGNRVTFHPQSVVGQPWNPRELFEFGQRNFNCDWMFWHYRENVNKRSSQFWWQDSQPVILTNQYFYE